ncbi:MAG: hypothetical protein Q9227_006923 [Pyrenula ochraceoflavens]
MSQPSGLFSVRRGPRETLGPITNYSGIPQPASAMKRSSSSSDLRNPPYTSQHIRSTSVNPSLSRPQQPNFTRSSSGNNLPEMGLSTVRRSASNSIFHGNSTARQSLAPNMFSSQQTPASASIQRRSSIYSRPSASGPMAHQSFFTQGPLPAGVPRDPRPLRDRGYQNRIGQELLDYLTHNNFELEMKHSLSQNTLKSPTQKDFNYIFQWLYRRLDPGYRFQKSIDAEVPPILKQLRYPFEKSITKSQIAAVGGQNWSTFLGLLHWMMQLAQMLDGYNGGRYDEACAEAGVDVSGDRIVFRFLFGAYQDWLQVSPDAEDDADDVLVPHLEQMAAEFEKANAKFSEELKIIEAENESLRQQIEEIEKSTPSIAKLDENFKILESDTKKFEDYNAQVAGSIKKNEQKLKNVNEDLAELETEFTKSEAERTSLQAAVDKQGLTIQDIDRMNTERERLQKALDDASTTLEEANRLTLEKEADTAQRLSDLETTVKRYNTLAYQMSLIPNSAANAKGKDYELALSGLPETQSNFSSSLNSSMGHKRSSSRRSPDSDRLLQDAQTGDAPSHILNLDARGTIRQSLLALRKEVNERRKQALETDLNRRDMLDSIHENLSELQSEVETLSHRVHSASVDYERLKDTTNTQNTQSNTAIEKLEKEMKRMKESVEEGMLGLEQKEMKTQMDYEMLVVEAGRRREELHGLIEGLLNGVVMFKVRIQEGLGGLEDFVEEEARREVEGEGIDGIAGGEIPAEAEDATEVS